MDDTVIFINPIIEPAQIKSLNWQLALDGPGRIVQGLQDIGQSVLLIVSTMKGSDPMRPTFGCDIFDHIDKPVTAAGPNMARAIVDAVNLWEPRITLTGVKYRLQDEHGEEKKFPAGIRFDIGWRLTGGVILGQTTVFLGVYDEYLNGVLNPPIVTPVFYILATENLDPILTGDGNEILL